MVQQKIKYSINNKMRNIKKIRTEKSPCHQIHLYKSTQLKTPSHIKNKHSLSRANEKSFTKQPSYSKSICVKNTDRDNQSYSVKSKKFIEPSLETSNCKYSANPGIKIKGGQKTYAQSRSEDQINKSYKIEDLLGINSDSPSKKSSIIVTINNPSHMQSINSKYSCCNRNNQTRAQNEVERIKDQNRQLMRANEMLLYQKQYFKQKMILQQVQIREMKRKLEDLQEMVNKQVQTYQNVSINKGHQKNKSEQSDLTFKLRHEKMSENGNKTAKKQNKLLNLANVSNKSSLLVSQSEEERIPLKQKENTNFQASGPALIVQKTQKQFSELLQSVQNQSNINRKTTLRKMLALKAMQLKKVKQHY